MSDQTQDRAALVALVRRVDEVGVRDGTDLADAMAHAKAALAAPAGAPGSGQAPTLSDEQIAALLARYRDPKKLYSYSEQIALALRELQYHRARPAVALTRYALGDGEQVCVPADDGAWVLWADIAAGQAPTRAQVELKQPTPQPSAPIDRLEPIPGVAPDRTQPIGGPIRLNDAQQQAAKEWAADDRLWTTQETVEINLRMFARVILIQQPSAPAAKEE